LKQHETISVLADFRFWEIPRQANPVNIAAAPAPEDQELRRARRKMLVAMTSHLPLMLRALLANGPLEQLEAKSPENAFSLIKGV